MGNSISFFGRVGKEPELKFTGDGTPILKLTVASDFGWGDKKSTNWFNVSSFGKSGEALANILRKGSKVVVHGELQIRKTTSDAGVKYTNVDVRANNIELTQSKSEVQSEGQTEGLADEADDDTGIPF